MYKTVLQQILRDIKKQYVYFQYKHTLVKNSNNSDIYIVEYPKGGITWFSTIVANINLQESNSKQVATYYNIQQLIPDMHMDQSILPTPIWEVPKYRFIKSHHNYTPYYNHVIYLVRNPISVMNSYYSYRTMLNHFDGTFEEFIHNKKYGLSTWIQHVESWLLKGDSSQRIHVVKYEDLKDSPVETLTELYNNLGIHVKKESIKTAIELSNFNNMKTSENIYKKNNPNTSLVFVREGKSKTLIDKKHEDYILEKTKHIREIIGY